MPPVLDPENSKVDGLAFLGLSLARNHFHAPKDAESGKPQKPKLGHPDSYTHQTAFDLNEVIDREYEFLQSTDDNGWLVGGGEAGPPTSYKLPALDSAHVEIMRVGTYRKDWGGLNLKELLDVMKSGAIRIPQIVVLPTDVVANPDTPPELEIRFDMECSSEAQWKSLEEGDFAAFCKEPLPINWQLRFLHNQLFRTFVFPSRFCPGAFHSTILRKADFRSDAHRTLYFCKCADVIRKWRKLGPKPLNTVARHLDGTPLTEDELEQLRQEAAFAAAEAAAEAAAAAEEDEESLAVAAADAGAAADAAAEEAAASAQESLAEEVASEPTATDAATAGTETEAETAPTVDDEEEDDYVPPTAEETEAMERLVKKLEAMAPLPPEATTARATSNLEVSLDEAEADADAGEEAASAVASSDGADDAPADDDDDDNGADDDDDTPAADDDDDDDDADVVNADDDVAAEAPEEVVVEAATTQDVENESTAAAIPAIASAPSEISSATADAKQYSEAYRHTWDDVVRVPSAEADAAYEAPTATEAATTEEEEEAAATVEEAEEAAPPCEEEEEVPAPSTPPRRTTTTVPPPPPEPEKAPSPPPPVTAPEECHSGIWLFTDRETITHFFKPNFLPPYDTPEKRRIIFEVLREEWHEGTLSWKPCGHGSMTRRDPDQTNITVLHKAETMVSGVLKTMIDSVCSPQSSPRRQSSATRF